VIRSIHIRGLGGHDDSTIDLDPDGVTELCGPSGAGKSTLLLAVCFALWGSDLTGSAMPVEAIRDGHDRCDVSLTLKSGTTFTRSMTRKRTISRVITKDGADTPCPTEELFRQRLGKLGADTEAIRVAMVPLAWRALAASQGNGRKLRDLLVRLLPGGDLRGEIASIMTELGATFGPTDPVDVKLVEEARTEANRRRDATQGRLEEARRRIATTTTDTPAVPPEADLQAAREIAAAAKAWVAYDEDVMRHKERLDVAESMKRSLEDWKARRAALGDRPTVQQGAELAARQAADAQERVVTEARRTVERAIAAIGIAEGRVVEAERAGDPEISAAKSKLAELTTKYAELEAAGDTCNTCKRPGWASAAFTIGVASDAVKSARIHLEGLERTADDRREKRLAGLRQEVEKARASREQAEKALTEAAARFDELKAVYAQASDAKRAVKAWDDQLAALGGEPILSTALEEPKRPETERPNRHAEIDAVNLIAQAQHARGAAEQASRQLAADKAALAQAETEAKKAAAEAVRLEHLVQAARRAPSEIARQQAAALGDLGPVSFEFLEGGGVEVKVDGRPWWLASQGELRQADLYLRLAIRRALGLKWLMVFVDEANLWSGDWPDAGPVCFLRTEPGEGIEVRKLDRRAA
jgi:hypothetical protein